MKIQEFINAIACKQNAENRKIKRINRATKL